MSSLEKATISFLKKNEINYYIEKEIIRIPCPFCQETVEIDKKNTIWECSQCKVDGNLKTLMDILKVDNRLSQIILYNPRKEKNDINYAFKRLINKQKHEGKELERLMAKVNKLFNYYASEK